MRKTYHDKATVEVSKNDVIDITEERGRFVARVYRAGRCVTVRRTER